MSAVQLDQSIVQSLVESAQLIEGSAKQLASPISKSCLLISRSLALGGKVIFMGNGGSAADAQHLSAELVGRFLKSRPGLPSISLTADTAVLTAIGNDFGYDSIFERQLKAVAKPGDTIVAMTSSGNSQNLLAPLDWARENQVSTIALTGKGGGKIVEHAETVVNVPSDVTAQVQELQLAIGHAICRSIDEIFVGSEHLILKDRPAIESKLVGWGELLQQRAFWKKCGVKVVWTNGCFDLIHVGHVQAIEQAKSFGDVLVVGLNTDESVSESKGATRPIIPCEQRARVLAAMQAVDFVLPFSESTPSAAIDRLRPDVHVKGQDYAPPNGKPMPEQALVESYGGRVQFYPLVQDVSTTLIQRRIVDEAFKSSRSH